MGRAVIPFSLLLFTMVLVGCSDRLDRRLERINAMTITDTRGALVSLDSIDPATLGEADRHFRDLLSIKAADKEYVCHTSDSIILDVIDYYSNSDDDTLCAEAFYYGGRVYSDMGDYPTALRYFQNALDLLPKNTPQQSLRSCVLSQTGRLLSQLRLNEQAIPYLRGAISIESNTNDSIGLMWDYELLGSVYLRLKDYAKARELYTQARNLAIIISPEDIPGIEINLATTELYQGDISSALNHIRSNVDKIDSLSRRWALSLAAKTYHESGSIDTAAIYAQELINDTTDSYQMNGYDILLSPDMTCTISQDSIAAYALDFRKAMLRYLRSNSETDAFIQNSMFNYQSHLQKRLVAEKSKTRLERWITATIILTLLLCIAFLYIQKRNIRRIINLNTRIESLNEAITTQSSSKLDSDGSMELKTLLISNLNNLKTGKLEEPGVHPDILNSKVLEEVNKHIDKRERIPENSKLWEEIEALILEHSENFKLSVQILNGTALDSVDYRFLLLLKCGLTSNNIAGLCGRSKSALTPRRKGLSNRFFGQELSAKDFGTLIRSL